MWTPGETAAGGRCSASEDYIRTEGEASLTLEIEAHRVPARNRDECPQHRGRHVRWNGPHRAVGERGVREDRVRAKERVGLVLHAEGTAFAHIHGLVEVQAANRGQSAGGPGAVRRHRLQDRDRHTRAVLDVGGHPDLSRVAEDAGARVIVPQDRGIDAKARHADVMGLIRPGVGRRGMSRTQVKRNIRRHGPAILVAVPRHRPIDLLSQGVSLVDVRQKVRHPAQPLFHGDSRDLQRPDGQVLVNVMVGMQSKGNLLEIVLALRTRSGFAHLSGGGNQQGDQDGDDGNDHQRLDQSKGASLSHNASEMIGGLAAVIVPRQGWAQKWGRESLFFGHLLIIKKNQQKQ